MAKLEGLHWQRRGSKREVRAAKSKERRCEEWYGRKDGKEIAAQRQALRRWEGWMGGRERRRMKDEG